VANWGIPLPGRGERVAAKVRSSATSALDDHKNAGRLTRAEVDERAAAVAAAQQNHEIDAVFGDLPQPHPRFTVDGDTGYGTLGCAFGIAVVVCTVIWIDNGFWQAVAGVTAAYLVLFTVNGIVGRRRLRELLESPHERQRREMRAARYDTGNLRLGDAERVSAAEMLIVHAAAGLPSDRYWASVERLRAARTRADLTEIFGHLPPPDPALADTVLSVKKHDEPGNLTFAITCLLLLPAPMAAIAAWAKFGQWYWFPAWFAAFVLTFLVSSRRKKATRVVPGMVG
jgi:hypothetical protein